MRRFLALTMLLSAGPALAQDPPAPPAEPPPAPKTPPVRVAVMDFARAGNAHPDLARVLSDAAAAEAGRVPGIQAISQGEIAAVLGMERTKAMLGCSEDNGCIVDILGALNADRLLSGSITVIEHTTLMTVRVVDMRKSRTLARANAALRDATEPELVDAARRLAHEALTGQKLDTTGTVRIAVDQPGAQVSLDGRSLGLSPVSAAQRVIEGPHTITVQKERFVRSSTTVSVAAGAEVPVSLQLVPIAALAEAARSRLWTWGWVSAGVAVAATGSGLFFGRQADQGYGDYVNATKRSDALFLHDGTQRSATLANVSFAVGGAAAVASAACLVGALISDASPTAMVLPIESGGGMLALGGRF